MNEKSIQNRLFHDLASAHSPAIPNYTPAGWFECDLFSVTKAGYFHEHEIKLSVADFRKDTDKAGSVWRYDEQTRTFGNIRKATKHSRLEFADTAGPCHFWYVMPQSVADKVEIPPFAGLKVCIYHKGHDFVGIKIVKPAPRLHSVAVDPKIIRHAFSVCYWRFWKERIAHAQLREAKKATVNP